MVLNQSGGGEPWNKGKLVGQKAPRRLKEIWAIRIRLHLAERTRELALFSLAIDSKLRSCDLVTLRVRDITHGERIVARAIVMRQKTQRPVSSRSPNRREIPWRHGSAYRAYARRTTCSRVASAFQHTCRRGNMRGSFTNGRKKSASIR
jgi:hypothetical protein